jgi:hypothetical protein
MQPAAAAARSSDLLRDRGIGISKDNFRQIVESSVRRQSQMVSFRAGRPRDAFAGTACLSSGIVAGGLRPIPSPAKATRADAATLLCRIAFLDLAPPLFGFEFSDLSLKHQGGSEQVQGPKGFREPPMVANAGQGRVCTGFIRIFWTREWLASLKARNGAQPSHSRANGEDNPDPLPGVIDLRLPRMFPACFRTIRIHPKRWNMNYSLPR